MKGEDSGVLDREEKVRVVKTLGTPGLYPRNEGKKIKEKYLPFGPVLKKKDEI